MDESNINNGYNNEGDSMDLASDEYDSVEHQRQVNTLQGTTAQVNRVNESHQVTNVPMQLNTSVIRGNTEPRATRDIWIRLKQHKSSILAFVCGVILTLVIVVPVMVSKSSSTEREDQAGYIFSLKFDRKSTHSIVFLSDDNTVMGNSFSKETPNAVNHPEQFNTYRGTIGDRCLTSTSKIYFEIKFSYEILKSFNSNRLIFEVGVASREKIDTAIYVANHGWSFRIQNCNTEICLVANYANKNTYKVKTLRSSNTAGTLDTRRLGFFVNMNRNAFSVIDKDSSKILFTFTNVVSTGQLCLVFGVHNPQYLDAEMKIMYSYNFTILPTINVIA